MAGRKRKPAWPSFNDNISLILQHLKDMGVDDNTIVVFTTDNGTEVFTWPDGGQTPFAQCKGTTMEGGFRVPCILRWPGHVPADSVANGIIPVWTGFRPSLPPPATRTSPNNCSRVWTSADGPTRTIWTVMTRWP